MRPLDICIPTKRVSWVSSCQRLFVPTPVRTPDICLRCPCNEFAVVCCTLQQWNLWLPLRCQCRVVDLVLRRRVGRTETRCEWLPERHERPPPSEVTRISQPPASVIRMFCRASHFISSALHIPIAFACFCRFLIDPEVRDALIPDIVECAS